MSGKVCETELRLPGTDHSSVWFQQDGTTVQTARTSVSALRAIFPQGYRLRGLDVPWLARSPDPSARGSMRSY